LWDFSKEGCTTWFAAAYMGLVYLWPKFLDPPMSSDAI
jgi:hypothetical protein